MNEPRSLKILVVEDEEDILILYNDFLSHRGHKVARKCPNIESIISYLEVETLDIFIIDYVLDGKKNGIEVAANIKQISVRSYLIHYGERTAA